MQNFINYLKDTVAELKRVSWPTSRQAMISTALVILISILVAIYIGLFDFVFQKALNWLVLPS